MALRACRPARALTNFRSPTTNRFRRWPLPGPESRRTPAARPPSRRPRICSRRRACIGACGSRRVRPPRTGRRSDASRPRLVGYSKPGELYDPLVHGETVGTAVGSYTFGEKGIRLNDVYSYVLYQLPQTLTNGEISMEVEGLRPNGPGGKPKIFQMLDTATAIPSSSKHMINAQYRGTPGNPDNSVAFKAVLGSLSSAVVEPDIAKRGQSVLMLDPSR